MSVAVRDPFHPESVIIYTKGADSQVLEKAAHYAHEREIVSKITHFAK